MPYKKNIYIKIGIFLHFLAKKRHCRIVVYLFISSVRISLLAFKNFISADFYYDCGDIDIYIYETLIR